MFNNLKWEINNEYIVGCLVLELRKAFDVLNHHILLCKVWNYKCSMETVNWFGSHLTNRTQAINIGNNVSTILSNKYRVPQGSVMDPLLFSIFVNDLLEVIKVCSIDMYADDITINTIGKSVIEIQTKLTSDLSQIMKWCEVNKMFINVNKSKSMLICSSQKRTSLYVANLKLVVNGIPVECVESVKILGLTINQTLSWHTHVDKVCLKMSRLIGLLWRIKDHLEFSTRILYYKTSSLRLLLKCVVWDDLELGVILIGFLNFKNVPSA